MQFAISLALVLVFAGLAPVIAAPKAVAAEAIVLTAAARAAALATLTDADRKAALLFIDQLSEQQRNGRINKLGMEIARLMPRLPPVRRDQFIAAFEALVRSYQQPPTK